MARPTERFKPQLTPPTPECGVAEIEAIKALQVGNASPAQQKMALAWIIEKGAATYATSYVPGGADAARASDFAEGRRFVGNLIVGVLKVKTGQTRG